MKNITIISGDIISASVDVIVNAANPKMLGGGGVDGAIHKAAGPKLLEACRKVKPTNGIRCPVGEARITSAGDLKSKFVIHTVGPRYRVDKNPESLLISAYQNSLDLAVSNECESIAFPAISCGAYGYPVQDAANISISICQKPIYDGLLIYFYLYGQKTVNIWSNALNNST